jgi:hypothetical protein
MPLRAGLRVKGRDGWEKGKLEVVDAETHIKAWLKESTPTFDLMLLKGGPGSGKSSLMKRMAVALTEDDPLQPLYFVELQHFDLEGGLEKSIEKYIKNHLDENPWKRHRVASTWGPFSSLMVWTN